MFPWGFPLPTNAMLQQLQHDLARIQDRFDAAFKAMLGLQTLPVAQTPADEVYAENKLRLLHYRPVVERPAQVPLLIVPSMINRYYLFDLIPGKSLVEHLVGRGLDVYMLDWGVPGPEDRFTTFDQYIAGYLRRMVQQVRTLSGQERISLMGYSVGGTFTAIFSALYGRHVRNLVQLAAPINFHDDGLLSQWTRKERFNVDLVVDTLGNMPAELMRASFQMLKPTIQIAQRLALAQQLGDTQAMQDCLAMQTWINDSIPVPGEVYRKYVKDCYQENYLVQGKLIVNGKRVDLTKIDCPLLTITAAKDLLCPPESVAVLNDLVASSDKQVLEQPGGHVGVVAGHRAASQLWPKLADWLIARSGEVPAEVAAEAPASPAPSIEESLQAGVEMARQVEESQVLLEARSPLEAMQQVQPGQHNGFGTTDQPAPAPETPARPGARRRKKPTE